MSAYMIATISVKDTAKFQRYLAETQKVARPYGAEMLLRSRIDRVLNGDRDDHGIVVVVRFPALEDIHRWYGSAEYRALVPLREAAADMTMTSYEDLN